jgi:cysteine desulfurase
VATNASLAFAGIKSEVLLHALEARGVLVSAGSACASSQRAGSHVLKALGVGDDRGVIRLTLGRETTAHETERAAEAIVATTAELRPTAGVHA